MMFYTEEELEGSAKSIVKCLDCCDAVVKYGFSRIGTVLVFMKNLLFQELNYYRTFVKD